MSNRITLSLICLLIVGQCMSQIVIKEYSHPEDINGTTQSFTFPSTTDDHTIEYEITNTSSEVLNVSCRRIENDVVPGIYSTTCWSSCPFAFESLTIPDWMVGTSTLVYSIDMDPNVPDSSFVFHYQPMGLQGESSYTLRFVNTNDIDETYGEIHFELNHLTNGIEELAGEDYLTLSPNPAKNDVSISTNISASNLTFNVFNLLGESVLNKNFTNVSEDSILQLDTRALPNGIYMVAASDSKQVYKTSRLVVQH